MAPMGMEESKIQKRIALECSDKNTRLWQNDNGLCYQGQVSRFNEKGGQSAVITRCKAIRYGLGTGTSDLIGFKKIKITPEMVGKDIAIFVGIEVKTNTGRTSKSQDNFLKLIEQSGGICGVARTTEEASNILNG